MQVTKSTEQPQAQVQMEPEKDDSQKIKNTKNNNANCSQTADSFISDDLQKNKGWYKLHYKSDHKLDIT